MRGTDIAETNAALDGEMSCGWIRLFMGLDMMTATAKLVSERDFAEREFAATSISRSINGLCLTAIGTCNLTHGLKLQFSGSGPADDKSREDLQCF